MTLYCSAEHIGYKFGLLVIGALLISMHRTLLEHAIARSFLSICPSFHHIPVFYPDEWRYAHAVFCVR